MGTRGLSLSHRLKAAPIHPEPRIVDRHHVKRGTQKAERALVAALAVLGVAEVGKRLVRG